MYSQKRSRSRHRSKHRVDNLYMSTTENSTSNIKGRARRTPTPGSRRTLHVESRNGDSPAPSLSPNPFSLRRYTICYAATVAFSAPWSPGAYVSDLRAVGWWYALVCSPVPRISVYSIFYHGYPIMNATSTNSAYLCFNYESGTEVALLHERWFPA